MFPIILAAVQFITVHGAGGQEYYINPSQITSMREPIGPDLRHFPSGIHCVIVTTSGKIVPVQEPCSTVRDAITALRKPEP